MFYTCICFINYVCNWISQTTMVQQVSYCQNFGRITNSSSRDACADYIRPWAISFWQSLLNPAWPSICCQSSTSVREMVCNYDVIKWEHFPRYWPFVRSIHRWPVDSLHKYQWRGALMVSLICAWRNVWANNRGASDLRRHLAHYDITVMFLYVT